LAPRCVSRGHELRESDRQVKSSWFWKCYDRPRIEVVRGITSGSIAYTASCRSISRGEPGAAAPKQPLRLEAPNAVNTLRAGSLLHDLEACCVRLETEFLAVRSIDHARSPDGVLADKRQIEETRQRQLYGDRFAR